MTPEYVLMIPHLSKELNLFGLPSLPYSLAKTDKKKSKNQNIMFNSKVMVETLINVCLELLKQVKTHVLNEDNNADKINFENIKLEKQLKQCKLESEKKIKALNSANRVNEHLQENLKSLENKLKNYEITLKSLVKKSQTDKNNLQCALKKKELDLFESYKMLRNQRHSADLINFEKDHELAQLNQSDFCKLWSKVKYSDARTREEALKEAVCIFQKNNKALMEEEYSLKTLLSSVLQEIHDICKLMINKMHMPDDVLPIFKNEMIWNTQGFNVSKYNEILGKHLKVFREVFELFDKASFVVSDDLFVCLSYIFKNFRIS